MDWDFSMIGPAIALGAGCVGSSIGCYIAGQACHAAMTKTDEGHGKLIGLSAAPASQSIYGFVLMLLMAQAIRAGTLTPLSGIGIALSSGAAILLSSVYQGKVCATGIQATLKNPSLYGKCFAAVGIIESFSLFAFVFALLLMK